MNINTMIKEMTNTYQKQLKKVLKEIAEEYKIDFQELDEKYLSPIEKQKKKRKKRNHVLTGYQFFLGDSKISEKIEQEHGKNIPFGELSKLKSKLWKELSKEEKDKFSAMAKHTKVNKKDEYEIKTE